jgi:hypothetical protein
MAQTQHFVRWNLAIYLSCCKRRDTRAWVSSGRATISLIPVRHVDRPSGARMKGREAVREEDGRRHLHVNSYRKRSLLRTDSADARSRYPFPDSARFGDWYVFQYGSTSDKRALLAHQELSPLDHNGAPLRRSLTRSLFIKVTFRVRNSSVLISCKQKELRDMPNYDFTAALSPLDFELLSKDLLEAELGIRLESFREGRDRGIDLRYAPVQRSLTLKGAVLPPSAGRAEIIVQCKRYSKYSDLKSVLERKELPKVAKLNPHRYILTTSVSLSPPQADELKELLSPFVISTDDVYGRERLNGLLAKHQDVERRHLKLWVSSVGVLNEILHARTYSVSREEVERTLAASRVYVKNRSFEEALEILKQQHVCIVSGIPGIGKTTLARMLLLYFYRLDFEIVKIESDISEARDVPYHSNPRFYYYDDFLGQTAQADKLNKNEDQKLLDFMTSVRDSKHALFVLTTREYILNQARLHYEKLAREKLDYRMCVMDLSKYSRRIRAEILYNHLHFSHLPRAHVQALISGRGYLKIVDHRNYNPRLIEYLTDSQWVGNVAASDYSAMFMRNLDSPVLIWEHAFDQQIQESSRDLLLVLATMPTESQVTDVGEAFGTFHGRPSRAGSLSTERDPFRHALKELDGTFISTRQAGEVILLQFHNPSIRDFVRGRLLSAPLLDESMDAAVFFEQARWFGAILFDERRYVPRHVAVRHGARIEAVLKRLADAPSCTIALHRAAGGERAVVESPNRAARLGEIAEFSGNGGEIGEDEFIRTRLEELERALRANQMSPASCLVALPPLRELGLLSLPAGDRFVRALKERASLPSDLDEFKTVAKLIEAIPEQFEEAERQEIRESFLAFAEQFVTDYENDEFGVDDPEEIRADAMTLESLSATFEVDTQDQQKGLHDHADQKERNIQEQKNWREDEGYSGAGREAECTDGELHSIFGTLSE